MLKTMDLVDEEDVPITMRQNRDGAIKGLAVSDARLSSITAPDAFICRQGMEVPNANERGSELSSSL